MNKKLTWAAVILAFLLVALVVRIVKEYDRHCVKKANPEFKSYLKQQQAQLDSIVNRLSNEGLISTSGIELQSPSGCFTSNFEGAEVLIAGLQHHDSIYGTKSFKPYYTYGCNYIHFDPDHPYYGLPDLEVKVGPVKYFQPELKGLDKLSGLGFSTSPKPYKVYRKPVYDSTGKKLRVFEMQLWLTQFKVAMTIISDRETPQVKPNDAFLNSRIYPGFWYQDSRKFISMNDLRDKREFMNHRYCDITVILEVNPNASPWYIKANNQQTLRPDIAIGAVVCNELIKKPEKENQIHINIQKGMLAPLFLEPFERDINSNIDSSGYVTDLANELQEYKRLNIWNRKYYIKLHSKNIGARQTGILWNKKSFDEQLEFSFLLPLLVVGSWDVQLPWDVIPEMEAPQPYYRSFSIKNLFPDWGIGGLGKAFSLLIILGVVALLFLRFFF
ncbi:MAG: hypothetical protein PWR03_27 [Tenuifilum sp.]|jgi:hypothetical protein|uniref:hypothetical protein n=1 Tax=Tenuifilum sp. TaxID=2760880 RepID=UPI0024AC5814|nr:hypothetical protein [Tenuifilum sp.]MDI3525844.1 hypothetical protein [Tenuifilum sp.]